VRDRHVVHATAMVPRGTSLDKLASHVIYVRGIWAPSSLRRGYRCLAIVTLGSGGSRIISVEVPSLKDSLLGFTFGLKLTTCFTSLSLNNKYLSI
jgi:hypothetical protein